MNSISVEVSCLSSSSFAYESLYSGRLRNLNNDIAVLRGSGGRVLTFPVRCVQELISLQTYIVEYFIKQEDYSLGFVLLFYKT